MIRVGTHKLLEPLINAMNKTIVVSSIVTVGIVHTLNSCNTLWLTFNKNNPNIVIDGVTYQLVSVTPNVSIVVTHPTIVPTVTEFDIALPFFFYGTIKSTNSELTEKLNSWDKLPMIYLHDPTKENYDADPFSSIDRESECDLYFLAENNFQDWTNAQHEALAIIPMRNMADAFIGALEGRRNLVAEDYTYELFNRVRWGTEETTGNNKQFFTDNVSGVQMRIILSFLQTNCNC